MSSITTYTKVHIDPLNPKVDELRIEDIAHALSMLCRANGHFPYFYSVAQHCLNCTAEADARGYSKKVQLACLLHDASEAYLSDITRPVKAKLKGYVDTENRLLQMIWNKWLSETLTEGEKSQVFEIDDSMLVREFSELMNEKIMDGEHWLSRPPDLRERSFAYIEQAYVNEFKRLTTLNTLANPDGFAKRTVGVDWANGRWIAVEMKGNSSQPAFYNEVSEICAANHDADAILIDIPIGLPESSAEAKFRPDSEARKRLGARRSSVFNVLFRQIAYAETPEKAWDLNKKLNAKMSILSLGIQSATRQVDEFLQANPTWKNRLMESHPELGFMALNGGVPMSYPKKEVAGEKERLSVLNSHGVNVERLIADFFAEGGKRSQINDLLDAACLSVNACDGLQYGFQTVPDEPMEDSTGLKMCMVVSDYKRRRSAIVHDTIGWY